MALDAFSFGNMGVSLNDIDMTFFTGYTSGDILPVIEAPAFDPDVTFWLDMTGSTTPYGTRNALFFSCWTGLVIMTDEAVDFVNSEMFSLN